MKLTQADLIMKFLDFLNYLIITFYGLLFLLQNTWHVIGHTDLK